MASGWLISDAGPGSHEAYSMSVAIDPTTNRPVALVVPTLRLETMGPIAAIGKILAEPMSMLMAAQDAERRQRLLRVVCCQPTDPDTVFDEIETLKAQARQIVAQYGKPRAQPQAHPNEAERGILWAAADSDSMWATLITMGAVGSHRTLRARAASYELAPWARAFGESVVQAHAELTTEVSPQAA